MAQWTYLIRQLTPFPAYKINRFFFTVYLTSFASTILGQSRSSTPSTLACDPATCPIIPGCETTINISKGRTGLGLSIVGGCDTLLVRNQNMNSSLLMRLYQFTKELFR